MPTAILNAMSKNPPTHVRNNGLVKGARPTHTRTLTTHTGLAQPVPQGEKVTTFLHLVRQWAPLMSELSRYPFSHPEDEDDSLPLHLTLDDYKAGLKPFAWIRPSLSDGLTKGWRVACPLVQYVETDNPNPYAKGCWYFSDAMLHGGFDAMSGGLRQIVHHLYEQGLINIELGDEIGEQYAIHADMDSMYFQSDRYRSDRIGNTNHALSFPRKWCSLLGIVYHGVTLVAYQGEGEDLKIWLSMRGVYKMSFPGMWDNAACGGLSSDCTELEGVIQEADEEASIPEQVIRDNAKCFGTVSMIGAKGIAEIQYLYKLHIPANTLELKCHTDEVEGFRLAPVREVLDELRYHPERYTYWAGIHLLRFFMSEGIIHPGNEPHYLEIGARMSQDLHMTPKRVA